MTDAHVQELSEEERDRYDRLGCVVRTGVFDGDEVKAMAEAPEELVADLMRDRQGHRLRAGSYVFDPDMLRGVLIKWEGDSDVVDGIEPFAAAPGLPVLAGRGRRPAAGGPSATRSRPRAAAGRSHGVNDQVGPTTMCLTSAM